MTIDGQPQQERPLQVLDDTVLVEYSQFYLVEEDSQAGRMELTVPKGERWLTTGTGWIVFLSGSSDHCPAVRIEAWVQEPTTDPASWDEVTETTLETTAEDMRLRALTMQPSEELIEIGPPGRYHVRAHRRGSSGVRRAVEDAFIRAHEQGKPVVLPEGVEQYLIQFWPNPA